MEMAKFNIHVNKYRGKTVMHFCSFDLRCIHGNGLQNPLTVFIAFKCECASFSIFKQYFEPVWAAKTAKQQIYKQNLETISHFVIKICIFLLLFFCLHDHVICKT